MASLVDPWLNPISSAEKEIDKVRQDYDEFKAARRIKSVSEKDLMDEVFKAFGEGYDPAINHDDTYERMRQVIGDGYFREDERPLPVEPWECRIGGSRFFVPPISISVNQQFKSGAITGSAIRQQSSPKFNSGHTETSIQMTLYFPNQETVLGYGDPSVLIDFDKDSAAVVDSFMSSLRGLIAQFKYAPFLPIRNEYLNKTYNITGVVLHSMTISSIENFPFAMAVNLTMLKFNHKTYLPMVRDFDQAIHWGRFRQYMGRAINALNASAKPFIEWDTSEQLNQNAGEFRGEIVRSIRTAKDILEEDRFTGVNGSASYSWNTEFTRGNFGIQPSGFELYFPFHTPARMDLPNLEDLKGFNTDNSQKEKNWWQKLLNVAGIDVNTYPDAHHDAAKDMADTFGYIEGASKEPKLLLNYFKSINNQVEYMGPAKMEEYTRERMKELGIKDGTPAAQEFRTRIKAIWFAAMYASLQEDPALARALAIQDLRNDNLTIQEWEIPMIKLGLNPSKVIVHGIAVSLGNSIARMQLQMQDEPTHQHIGGQDTRIDISMTIFGEDDLLKLRKMFEGINGLARLEHGHGVLGFLGIDNVISRMCGVRYAIPLEFNIETTDGYPHVYNVTLSLTDFDVFQQKRETLTSEQQAELIQAFSKWNPFLRVKQMWGAFNAYPDFPLDIRDDKGYVVGHLDPDFYFRSFKTIDDDIVDRKAFSNADAAVAKARAGDIESGNHNFVQEEGVHVVFMKSPDTDEAEVASITANGMSLYSGKTNHAVDAAYNEPHAGNMIGRPYVDGLAPPSSYIQPYYGDAGTQYELMMRDMQYRDNAGRMIRAYPTYMLWLIDEGGTYAGVRMFDNFYGLQAVLDFSIVQSEDILGDTLVMRVSNLYSRLSTKFRDYLDPDLYKTAKIINENTKTMHRLTTGLSDYLVQLDTIDLKPGIRVHMRMGYGANPNSLETVFNGTITEVEVGEVMTITCQSDAIELSAPVNTTNKKGHTGKIDGDMMGLYMSEPRDLMISLLTRGSSVSKEVLAHATKGMIFSESRWGIRHFGMMLYEPLTEDEREKQKKRSDRVKDDLDDLTSPSKLNQTGGVVGLVNIGFTDVVKSLWTNLNAKQDYEIFKRNIYPGNGSGIAQYMGGDVGELGLNDAIGATGVSAAHTANPDPLTGQVGAQDPLVILAEAIKIQEGVGRYEEGDKNRRGIGMTFAGIAGGGILGAVGGPLGALVGGVATGTTAGHVWMDKMGLVGQDESDKGGAFDEVSFRAQTHMKSVWDLFLICAGLLPDYIVAVRPFEDRSTIFYGKPHWLYTSGVIPLTTGNPSPPPRVEPDEEMRKIYERVDEEMRKTDDLKDFETFYQEVSKVTSVTTSTSSDPTATTSGMVWSGSTDSILSQKTYDEGTGSQVDLPATRGRLGLEMHLPTDSDLEKDKQQHLQTSAVPPQQRHPFYMDRINGGVGGVDGNNVYSETGTVKKGDKATDPGKPGAMGYLTPEQEQWYMNMRWTKGTYGPSNKDRAFTPNSRILIYNDVTKKAVVCAPGDYGPAASTNKVAGCSPDVYYALGSPTTECHYRVMPRGTKLGPVNFGDTVPQVGSKDASEVIAQGDEVLVVSDGTQLPTWAEGTANVSQYAYDNGWKREGIPIDFSEAGGAQDEAGKKAHAVYMQNPDRNRADANQIWDEFRKHFPKDKEVSRAFESSLHVKNLPVNVKSEVKKDVFNQLVDEFMKFMWQNPYARGWLVITSHKRRDLTETAIDSTLGAAGAFIGFGQMVQNITGLEGRVWDFGPAYTAFKIFIEQGINATVSHLQNHDDAGRDESSAVMHALETTGRIISDIKDWGQKALSAVTTVAGGLMNFMRLSLVQLSSGLSMASEMAAVSNRLNKIYNDSIYYSAGPPNTILRYADNPFTREYAEPVVEVREPFQRVHTIGSFQHILSNMMMENSGVATVVTAVSNGSHPQTVHFDKGAPAERQVEKVVETGLFWDHPKGWFGVKKLINPIETQRWLGQVQGSGDQADRTSNEIAAKRVALWHLKESLKDIYAGEILIIGDAKIRPHDLVYIGDVYERIFGFFEVEQVVHHFTPETGFITAITPNACVTINDPARFSLLSYWKGRQDVQSMRNHLKQVLEANADNQPTMANLSHMEKDEFIQSVAGKVEVQMENSRQFTGGNTAVIKSIASAMSSGSLVPAAVAANPGLGLPAAWAGWKAWGWVRDNLLDQHGCYIQYLTHNGQPMDAGLSHNQGVAVGQQFATTMIFNGLKLGELSTMHQGQSKIRTNDVIKRIQWDEFGPNDAAAEVDMFVDLTNAQVRNMSGRGSDGYLGIPNEVYWVQVDRVVDGDTFKVTVLGQYINNELISSSVVLGQNNTIRPAASDAAEDPWKNNRTVAQQNFAHPGVQATRYTRDTIEGHLLAIRVNPIDRLDQFGRVLAYVFHNYPEGLDAEDAKKFMLEAAGGWPAVSWDSYMDDGRPYTLNWELVSKGYADIYIDDLGRSLPGRGVRGSAW